MSVSLTAPTSLLAMIGQLIFSPIFRPLGFADWRDSRRHL
jgi:Fe2+ transport system protein B